MMCSVTVGFIFIVQDLILRAEMMEAGLINFGGTEKANSRQLMGAARELRGW